MHPQVHLQEKVESLHAASPEPTSDLAQKIFWMSFGGLTKSSDSEKLKEGNQILGEELKEVKQNLKDIEET